MTYQLKQMHLATN